MPLSISVNEKGTVPYKVEIAPAAGRFLDWLASRHRREAANCQAIQVGLKPETKDSVRRA